MADQQSRYSRLAQITELINTKLDLHEVLEHVVTAISEEIVQCDSVGIYLPQEDGTYKGYVGKPALINGMTLDMHIVDPDHDLLAKEVIETGEAIYIPDTSKDDRPDRRAIDAFKINSLLVLPISHDEDHYGLVFLFDYGIPMNLTASEIESVKAYVNMAAVAIRNAKNLTRKEDLISEKQLLLNVTRELSLCSNLKEALECCFSYLGKVLKNSNIGAHFVDPLAERQIQPASLSKDSDWTEEDWKKTHSRLKVDHTKDLVFKEVISTRKSIFIPDTFADPRPNHEACRQFGIKGLYMIPLIAMGEVLGTIAIVNLIEKNQTYPNSSMQLAESIVDATAPVLSNLIYMEKQELIISDRTSQLTKKNAELEQVVKEIKKLSREKELILNSAGEGIFGLDLDGNITFCNPSAISILGYKNQEELIGESYQNIFDWRFSEKQDYSKSLPKNFKIQRNHDHSDEFFFKKDRSSFPVEYVITPQKLNEDIVGYVVTFKDVSSRKQMEEKIKYHAYYDSVTNIPNRVLFHDRLSQALTYAELHGSSLSVLFLDLDRFKKINDTFGHGFGDIVLKKVADRLESAIPKEATVSRQGGDEFIILLPRVKDKDEAILCAEDVLNSFSTPFSIQGQEIAIKTSIGISVFPENGVTADLLIKNADVAMYKAKEQTGNKYQLYSPDIEDRSLESLQLENDLFKALDQEEFVLYYQPKVNTQTNDITGVEALIRWNHPKRGLLAPSEFIPLAEETGLILAIGEWVIKQACLQMRKWHDQGYTWLEVSVNLSPQQFNEENLPYKIEKIIAETELPPQFLELELTENLIIHNTDKTLATIQQLKRLGIKISIDDFGTGYSSLGYLKDFPVDTLKIDKSFIDDITTNSNNAAITNTIITLAKSLNLHVIAEGVETKDQVDFLSKHGCLLIQGYFFSKPVKASQFLNQYLLLTKNYQ
ncbi:EAL domain-containing protein [Halobacillus salinarum]|uniref:EAL domain-containing protein n=1 Tax=Halobacillus salinarum TaxID=2932257 RepID=A0ABY4ELI2_9BACI|nr:EAL domain-containing protein [Halobacillus salinarum]UOQ44504.1 EAL domain-containing protein [Halobacillus salinarum]